VLYHEKDLLTAVRQATRLRESTQLQTPKPPESMPTHAIPNRTEAVLWSRTAPITAVFIAFPDCLPISTAERPVLRQQG
jgi:hypothetical protein